jgi:hypothetical protein
MKRSWREDPNNIKRQKQNPQQQMQQHTLESNANQYMGKTMQEWIDNLKKENAQLKELNRRLTNSQLAYQCRTYAEENRRLLEENNKLKRENLSLKGMTPNHVEMHMKY